MIGVVALALAGCSDDSDTGPSITVPKVEARACSNLSEADVERVSNIDIWRIIEVGVAEGSDVACGTIFVGLTDSVVLTHIEHEGGAVTLRRVRSSKGDEPGVDTVTPLPALGPRAFLAGERFVAFLRDDEVVTLETGFDDAGESVLTVRQLVQLGRELL